MQRRASTKVQVDSNKIKEYVYKNGDTYQKLCEAIGYDNTQFGRCLKAGEMPKVVYTSMLSHYGIKNQDTFILESVKKEEKKLEENKNILLALSAISEKLDKLDYINKNICEWTDQMQKFTESVDAFNESVNAFLKAMQS